MREIDTTFFLLIAATLLQPVSAVALQRDLIIAESSCAINNGAWGAWYGHQKFGQLAGGGRISLVRMTNDDPEHDSNLIGRPSLLPPAEPRWFGTETGVRHHHPTGLQTLVHDVNITPSIDHRVNSDYSLNRGSASG